MKILTKIEKDFPVNTWEVDGVHIWPLIRNGLSYNLFSLPTTDLVVSDSTSKCRIFKRGFSLIKQNIDYIKTYIWDFRKNDKINNRQADVLFLNNTGCRRNLKDVWYDVFCDPIIEKLNNEQISHFVLEWNNSKYRMPRNNKSKLIQPFIDYIRIKTKLIKKNKKYQCTLSGLEEFNKYLQSIDARIELYTSEELCREYHFLDELARRFSKDIKVLKPKIAFVSIYYTDVDLAFILACKRNNVITVDIQHGVQGRWQSAYGQWSNIPSNGYELLPDVFWNWSQVEFDAILEWSQSNGKHHPFVGGNLFLEQWLDQSSAMIKHYDNIINVGLRNKQTSKITVLYTSNYGKIPKYMIDVIKSSSDIFTWWIRIHPGMIEKMNIFEDDLKQEGLTDVEIQLPTTLPLPALIRYCDVHITAYSTVVLEAEKFGVASVVTDKSSTYRYGEQINSGVVIEEYEDGDLISAIKKQALHSKRLKNVIYTSYNREEVNVIRNLFEVIEKIKDKSKKTI
ncbi:hypothetical protein [Pelosinus fermentans]|nr:hypothetical protein [Pelosinus fermentans]